MSPALQRGDGEDCFLFLTGPEQGKVGGHTIATMYAL